MWCAIYKWNISRAADSGKTPEGLTKRHLEKCASCREFHRLSQDLEKRLAADASALLGYADPSLAERIQSKIGTAGPTEAFSPAPSRPKSIRLRPVWAAAASLAIVIGISLIWTLSSPPTKMPPLDPVLGPGGPRA